MRLLLYFKDLFSFQNNPQKMCQIVLFNRTPMSKKILYFFKS